MRRDAFERLPAFRTERLDVRPLAASDARAMHAIKGDRAVTERYGRNPHRSLAETRHWIDGLLARDQKDSMFWVFVPRGESTPIGSCCYWHFDLDSRCAEIGYELRRDHWGRGFMAEALLPVLSYGFEGLGLHRIEACPMADNRPSMSLLLGLGFTYEGSLRQRVLFRGRTADLAYFGLLKAEWKPPLGHALARASRTRRTGDKGAQS